MIRMSRATMLAAAAAMFCGPLATVPRAPEPTAPIVRQRKAGGNGGGRGKPSQPYPRRGKWSLKELRAFSAAGVRVKNPKILADIEAQHQAWHARRFGQVEAA